MGTPLQWLSFAIPFRIYDPFFPFPFKWITSEKKLLSRSHFEESTGKFKNSIWLGPIIIIITCCLFGLNIIKLCKLGKSERKTLQFYFQFVAAIAQFLLAGVFTQYSVYYTKNANEMGVLFTDSHKAMTEGIDRFNGWHLVQMPPFYRDILGVAFCAFTLLPIFSMLCVPPTGVYFGIDPLGHFMPNVATVKLQWIVLIIFIRVAFYVVEVLVTARWICFVCIHLAMVLSIGNMALGLLLKVVCERKPRFLKRPRKWEEFLIFIVVLQRRIVLHTQIWSRNIGSLIFIIYTSGIDLWSASNYTLILLRSALNVILTVIFILVSGLSLAVFLVLVPFVSNIAINSQNLNRKLVSEMKCYKLGNRYAKTLRGARISTPFFTFTGNNFPNLLGIPFDITMNLVLTFPVTIQ
ncbi:unnamed protein product [Orchesella dallaii]|uniref:Uncharacterized protein n=1 Tax=Orchesella dallaii TaxID=48710 RepID=A0ABP1PZJ6_9HEXA